MGRFAYARPDDNLASLTGTTVTLETGTPDADYPIAQVGDGDVTKPGKIGGTTGRISFDFGAPVQVEAVAILHHNLVQGMEVNAELHTADTWGTPDFSFPMTMPTFGFDRFPDNPWVDLRGTSPVRQFLSVEFATANSANIAIGEIVIVGTLRRFSQDVRPKRMDDEMHTMTELRTELGVSHITQLGTRFRSLTARFWLNNANNADDPGDMRSLQRSARGRAKPFLVIPDDAANDAWYVRFSENRATVNRTRRVPLNVLHEYDLTFEEVVPGLTLIDPSQ